MTEEGKSRASNVGEASDSVTVTMADRLEDQFQVNRDLEEELDECRRCLAIEVDRMISSGDAHLLSTESLAHASAAGSDKAKQALAERCNAIEDGRTPAYESAREAEDDTAGQLRLMSESVVKWKAVAVKAMEMAGFNVSTSSKAAFLLDLVIRMPDTNPNP